MKVRLTSHPSALLLALTITLTLLTSCGGKKAVVKESIKSTELSMILKDVDKKRKDLVKEAYSWIGTPYRYARAEKGCGTDCSGMVLKVYEKIYGVKLPRNSAKQAEFCKRISKSNVKSGDLVFFATGKDTHKVSHVGIMVDKSSFIHSSSSKGVCISQVETPYYTRTLIQYGRVPGI